MLRDSDNLLLMQWVHIRTCASMATDHAGSEEYLRMAKYTSRVSSRGQVTIPSELRRTMGIKPQDRVALEQVDGGIKISPSGSGIAAGYGAVTPQTKPEDSAAIRREVASEWATGRRRSRTCCPWKSP